MKLSYNRDWIVDTNEHGGVNYMSAAVCRVQRGVYRLTWTGSLVTITYTDDDPKTPAAAATWFGGCSASWQIDVEQADMIVTELESHLWISNIVNAHGDQIPIDLIEDTLSNQSDYKVAELAENVLSMLNCCSGYLASSLQLYYCIFCGLYTVSGHELDNRPELPLWTGVEHDGYTIHQY